MRVRVTKVDEYQFLTCLKHRLWGSKSSRFKDWRMGDAIVFLVGKSVAGLAYVSGPPFQSKEPVWDTGIFPHRIPLGFKHVISAANRPPVLGEIRDSLVSAFGPNYGWGILTQQALPEMHAEKLVGAISASPNQLGEFEKNLDELLLSAKIERGGKTPPRRSIEQAKVEVAAPVVETSSPAEESLHTRTQYELAELGRITGCAVWVASNDRSRTYKGKKLGDGCLKVLPNLGLNPEVTDRIARIDVLWLRHNAPLCAFEVEATTQVFSGLLRMADLLALVPALKMKLYIVAAKARQAKVLDELDRPIFRKIGLSDYCEFISFEDLRSLLDKVGGFRGHVEPTVLDKIAIALPDDI
jgi:hypothetical protein